MEETKKKEDQSSTHKIGIYLWIWGLLFVLSFFSYLVDWYQFQGMLRWSLILFFMFLKAGLIMAFFMLLIIGCNNPSEMVAEGKYTLFSRLFYFFVGG